MLNGDRDWVIEIECGPHAVSIPLARLQLSAEQIGSPDGAALLLQAVQRLIDRRQASVRPGEVPYRPQLRFVVKPGSLRTFHLAYPALQSLPIPKTRQDAAADEPDR
jgi:hypothetical protein